MSEIATYPQPGPPPFGDPEPDALPVEEVSRADALQAEAAPTEKPAGSPDLWPFLQLPRRKRAEFLRAVDPILGKQDALAAIGDATSVGPSEAADLFDMLADIEDALWLVVKPDEAEKMKMAAWVVDASDADLMSLLAWYMERFQVGEAPASSS